jgi:hypothetical protein
MYIGRPGLDKSFYGDRQTNRVTDTEANTIVRPLYLFITIVIIKEGQTKNHLLKKFRPCVSV